ncbi:hypothetical protein [Pseudomonas sp.]|uniref:hypothetical protein n=1 Tax=Pseudomonas sp. TaxID=306 RepID=UPI003A9772A9
MTAFILWEQSLLAMAVVQLMKMLDVSASSRASFAPTGSAQTGLIDAQPQETGRLSGRLAFDFDLGAPLTTLAERRYCVVGIPAWMPG